MAASGQPGDPMCLPDMGVVLAGLAGRFPKADSVAEFEEHLRAGSDMVTDQDETRFECGLWGLPRRAGRLKDLSRFDASFFGYSPEQANYLDYQLRILYEVVYESILDAGLNPAQLRGSNTGVFFGLHCNEFENALADEPNFQCGGYYAQFALKIAQYFDLRGLTVTFDAACASGFVGLHNAAQALKSGLIERAIVCSSNIPIHPTGSFIFLQMQMLSPTGYSRFLDSRADGYVKSESCVSVLLEPSKLAKRSYGSLMATMTSVDGYKPEGITFPSASSQTELIRATKLAAGVSTNHVEYLEAHGTGTPAGDPQEARAIASVYCPAAADTQNDDPRTLGPLLVGSVKTNMGHSEAASGLCALVKVALMLEHETIYGGLHYDQPNTNIEALRDGRLEFASGTRRLRSKVVPLSCYGFGGSNVHAIVRANPRPAISTETAGSSVEGRLALVCMFGRTEASLSSFLDRMLDSSSRHTRNCLSPDFLALVNGLSAHKIDRLMGWRAAMLVDTLERRELWRELRPCELPKAEMDSAELTNRGPHLQDCQARHLCLLLPGLGSHWGPGMASGLRDYPPLAGTLNRLAALLEPQMDLWRALDGHFDSTGALFGAIVAVELALVNLVQQTLQLGPQVSSIVGHSLGELACAYAAGLIDERVALLAAVTMGRVLDDSPEARGAMLALVGVGGQEALELAQSCAPGTVSVACYNGRRSVTLSGDAAELDGLEARLASQRAPVLARRLEQVRLALHNRHGFMTSQVQARLEEALKPLFGASIERPQSVWSSSVMSAQPDVATTRVDASYFASALCQQVDLSSSLSRLPANAIVLELGPSGAFEAQVRDEAKSRSVALHYVSLLRRNTVSGEQVRQLLASVGRLYLSGANMDVTRVAPRPPEAAILQLPLCRQTPSLSSMFGWDHQQVHFVPRYPAQFSKSSAKCEIPVDIVSERDKYLADHRVDGRTLYPATGYLLLIWRVFSFVQRQIHDACFQSLEHELVPIEFSQVRLTRAVMLGNRVAQLYVHFEQATGRFQVKEGGSLVAEGLARSPRESPEGLLYEHIRNRAASKSTPLDLSGDDVYKQFRLSGYDYGEHFRNIISASADGRRSLVRFNGYFVALTDSILQSVLLAVGAYTPSGGLYLPTRFDYVRFQPEILLAKLRAAGHAFDQSDEALDTRARREIMQQVMQREQFKQQPNEHSDEDRQQPEVPPKPAECLFETFCDPDTGVIITDGIEMRGVRASPAPRRIDASGELLLESHQFVADHERPIQDEHMTGYESQIRPYVRACNALAVKVLKKQAEEFAGSDEVASEEELEQYLKTRLLERAAIEKNNKQHTGSGDQQKLEAPVYDIKRNGDLVLLSVLDLMSVEGSGQAGELCQRYRGQLSRDLLVQWFASERLMRPLLDTVVDNCCARRARLRVVEVNSDDALIQPALEAVLQAADPPLTVDYSLVHPDPNRLTCGKPKGVKTFTWLPEELTASALRDGQVRDVHLSLCKDVTCYPMVANALPARQGLAEQVSAMVNATERSGYIMLLARERLTLAERALWARDQPEVNELLASRLQLALAEAERCQLQLISTKSDPNGCIALLWRAPAKLEGSQQVSRKLIQVQHHCNVEWWLSQLKAEFAATPQDTSGEESVQEGQAQPQLPAISTTQEGAAPEPEVDQQQTPQPKADQVWLVAVATRQHPVSGLVGMVQALRKEVGSARLRCYMDMSTFAHCDEPVGLDRIEASASFRQALVRDQLWNCVAPDGSVGAYRHFGANRMLGPDRCLCNVQPDIGAPTSQVLGAYVNTAKRGDLASLAWFEAPLRHLSPSGLQSLVQVAYSALNFRDVMLATGRLPLDAVPARLALSDCLLGLEFAGVDASGARVMGMVGGRGIASHVLCPPNGALKLEVPPEMSLAEAATIPVVYATAVMALVSRGRARAGESVLIHAASGGVGQAALRLAGHLGLQVYATVGSDDKRDFLLREFPEVLADPARVFSSRTCDFEQGILRATRGRGVDLVLNSLADDKLQASVRCLAQGGRFLEIGKYDMSIDAGLELSSLDQNQTFHGILLDMLFEGPEEEPLAGTFARDLEQVLRELSKGLQSGWVRPIKFQLFKRNQVEQAFRYMATGKHIGKVLIEIDPQLDCSAGAEKAAKALPGLKWPLACVPRVQLNPSDAYLVTGGLGGFGLELCKWLVANGARQLVLTSRSGPQTGYQRLVLERLGQLGASVRVVLSSEADASHKAGAEQLCQLSRRLAPSGRLGGLFHLAMVLQDALLERMTAQQFEQVCSVKAEACQHLDEATRGSQWAPRWFVAFSSVTSAKGNSGQLNYAYANSCLERICEQRRAAGLHGLAIQWGAVGDVGVAFDTLGGNEAIIGGTRPQRMPSCLATLGALLEAPFHTCMSLVPASSRHAAGPGAGADRDLVSAILHVLGIKDASKVSEQATLGELGLDSLMAVEIRQYIEREFDKTLNIDEIRALTIEKIRDIGDKGKSSVASTSGADSEAAATANQNQKRKQQAALKTQPIDTVKPDQNIDLSALGGFVPQLRLPAEPFSRLNGAEPGSGRPLFLLAPVHGSFEQLAAACAHISRPCWALNASHELAKPRSLLELARGHLELLRAADWCSQFGWQGARVVDLVGYSYGATVAFEMLVELHSLGSGSSAADAAGEPARLEPGRLVLLDGSPLQIQLGSEYLSRLSAKQALSEADRLDQMLLACVLAHAQSRKHSSTGSGGAVSPSRQVNVGELLQELRSCSSDRKSLVASAKLVEMLELEKQSSNSSRKLTNGSSLSQPSEDVRQEVALAMESLCRRYQTISSYKPRARLAADCALIRADKLYVRNHSDAHDLGLGALVDGQVSVYVLPGDHDTFVGRNARQVAQIVEAQCAQKR